MVFKAHPIDLGIFLVFLAITLIVGLGHGRQTKTMRDYALGGKNFSTFTLTATIVATWFGGGTFYYVLSSMYSTGLYFIIATLGGFICLLITGQLMAVRMQSLLNNVSVAEAMGDMYGKTIQVISAISGAIVQIGYIAMQFRVITKVLALMLGTHDETLSIIAAAIVILYSTVGGIKAVTFTDVAQFFTFGTIIPILALIVYNDLQSPQQITVALAQSPQFHLKEVVGWNSQFIGSISLMLYYTMMGVDPSMFQRVAMARSIKQARYAFSYAGVLTLLIYLCMAWLAILLLADNPNLASDKLVNYLIDRYAYIGLKGFLAASIVALAMSTADSCMNACVVLFTNDLIIPLGLSKRNPIFIARLSTVIVGLLGLLLSLYESDLLALLLLTGSFYMPIVGVPLGLAIFGFRSSKRTVFISMAVGFITVILWRNFLAHTGIDSVTSSTLISLVVFLSSHYLLGEPGGWQKVTPDSPLGLERAARQEAWQRRWQTIQNFKLYPYLQKNLPLQEGLYPLLGFYAIIATYSALYAIESADAKTYKTIYETIVHAGLFATTAFITFPIWPPSVKSYRFMAFFWPLGIAALLFFSGTLIAIISHFQPIQMMVLMTNLLIAALLLHGPLAIVLAVSGISLAISFFHHYTGEALPWDKLGSSQFSILYGLLVLAALLIALLQGKQAYAQLGNKNQALTRLDQENQARLLQAALENNQVLQALKSTGVEQLLTLDQELKNMHISAEDAERMQALRTKLIPIVFHLQGIDTRARDYLRLHIDELPVRQCCSLVKQEIREKGIHIPIHFNTATHEQKLFCDTGRITNLLIKSITLLSQQELPEETPTILVALEDTWLHYPLSNVKQGYIKQVTALRIGITTEATLPPVADYYKPTLADTVSAAPETPQALEQLANERVIKAHYGYAQASPHTLLYVIPVDVKEVRPRDMDKPYMELGAAPQRANDHFKNATVDAQAQEKEFLTSVAAHSQADIGLVKIALELIKWYHGPVERHSGEPFYLHPLAVAQIVLDYNQDEATIIGALLHDTVEDTSILIKQLETVFGKETAEVVNLVTHLQSIEGSIYKVKLSAEENLKMLERTGNKPGLYVKLADRMHNMRTIEGHKNLEKRRQVAEETLQFFVPLAERLGLHQAAQELRQRCLAILG